MTRSRRPGDAELALRGDLLAALLCLAPWGLAALERRQVRAAKELREIIPPCRDPQHMGRTLRALRVQVGQVETEELARRYEPIVKWLQQEAIPAAEDIHPEQVEAVAQAAAAAVRQALNAARTGNGAERNGSGVERTGNATSRKGGVPITEAPHIAPARSSVEPARLVSRQPSEVEPAQAEPLPPVVQDVAPAATTAVAAAPQATTEPAARGPGIPRREGNPVGSPAWLTQFGHVYRTLEECARAAARLGFATKKEYEDGRAADRRLPSDPAAFALYRDAWEALGPEKPRGTRYAAFYAMGQRLNATDVETTAEPGGLAGDPGAGKLGMKRRKR